MTQETRRDLRFPMLALAVSVGAVAVCAVAVWQGIETSTLGQLTPNQQLVLGILLAGVLVAELLDVAIPGAGAISMSFPLYIATAVYLGPVYAAIVAAVSLIPSLLARWRSGWARLAFNMGQIVMTASVPGVLYVGLGGVPLLHQSAQSALPLVVAGIAGTVVNLGLSALGVSFLYRERLSVIWKSAFAWLVPSQVMLGFIGLAIAEVLGALDAPGFGLFVLPLLVARQTYQQSVKLREAYADTISSLVAALEAKDVYTKGHSVRVAEYTVLIAEAMGFSPDKLRRIEQGALLHDVGKVGVSRRVLAKEARLTDGEYDEIKRHPDIGAHIVADVPYLADLVPMIEHHHTWFDGHGYGGASSDDIPLEARILAVADSYDAMTSARPYRGAMSHEEAVRELRRCSWTQFDPAAVAAFEVGYAKASETAAAQTPGAVAPSEA